MGPVRAGILCQRVMRKAGIFLLPPPPHTHVLRLPLSSTRFKPELFAQALSSCGESIGGAPCCTAPLGRTRFPGTRDGRAWDVALGMLISTHHDLISGPRGGSAPLLWDGGVQDALQLRT